MSKTVAAAEFEAHSLALLEEVAENQEELVILDDGKPLVKVVPADWHRTTTPDQIEPRRAKTLEELRGSVTTLGDIVEPLDDEWDVMK
jgi:antitoxin (DNA-binding transcriptional repressor) of toxin-antitoxin stability system